MSNVVRVSPQPSTRIYAILARKSPMAVIFRRGPSKKVLTLSWNTDTHEFRLGQWFKGRIYERRCDLSPSGEKLIYFAASQRPPFFTWTAISRPPFLKALALWPKGDAWGGGGLFLTERTISLNHGRAQTKLADNFSLPKSMTVETCGRYSGAGEDDPILAQRLARDGWQLTQAPEGWTNKIGSRIWHEFSKKEIWIKARGSWTLEMAIAGIRERDGSWYVTEHRVLNDAGRVVLDIGRSDWADWSQSGELLFARQGRLYRVVPGKAGAFGTPEELIDLSQLKFEAIVAPSEASVWNGRAPRGRVLVPDG